MSSTMATAGQWLRLSEKHNVNVTTRAAVEAGKLKELTVATVRLWKHALMMYEQGKRESTMLAPESTAEVLAYTGDPAVTVWGRVDDTKDHFAEGIPTLTVHSYTTGQQALDVLWAHVDACNEIRRALREAAEKTAPPAPEPPKQDIGQVRHVGALKKGVEVIDGELVSFDLAKIELQELNGLKKWVVYPLMGKKPGQFPSGSLTIYSDNDLSMKAVGDALSALALTPGAATEGRWLGVYKVSVKGDKTSYYPVRFSKAS